MKKTLPDWNPPKDGKIITTIDAHTAGEPLRIITKGLPDIPGDTILAKRRYFQDNLDHIRTGLMWEPRGHADMYGSVLTEPVTLDGDFGVIFLHNQGYSSMCGHAIIALATVTLDTGMIKKEGNEPDLNIDTPAGRIKATAHRIDGKVRDVSFWNVPSFVYCADREIDVEGVGGVRYDVAFGGAFYALCDAQEVGIGLEMGDYNQLIDWGKRIKHAVMKDLEIKHPFEQDLGFLYGTIFVGPPEDSSHHSRNVCIFADGQVDRSPTGTGISARAALHHSRKELAVGQSITVESILGTCFQVRVVEINEFGPYTAVIPEVTGSAYVMGQHTFYFDPDDPMGNGFIFR